MSDSSLENYGDNIVENGTFSISSIGWTLSGGATYSDGSILFPSEGFQFKSISQPLDIIPLKSYLVSFTLTVISGEVSSSVLLGDVGKNNGASSGLISNILTPTTDGYIRISVETYENGAARINDVSVKEILSDSDSSLTTISSASSSGMSSSSTLFKSQSSSNSHSSITTFSSDSSTKSDSSTSFSESSSSSSGYKGHVDFPFKIEAYVESPVWCFERVGEKIYAGTGRNGVVLSSKDMNRWNQWKVIPDSHVKSLKFYANGLFIGTEPKGYIYVHNFTTNAFYRFVETSDHSVTSMAIFNGKLYVGTSPGGQLFVFNGDYWKKQKEFYGGGINSLFVKNDALYASVKSAETILVFTDETSWEIAPTADSTIPEDLILKDGNKQGNLTLSSHRNLSTEPVSDVNFKFINRMKIASVPVEISNGTLNVIERDKLRPINPSNNIKTIGSFGDNLLIGDSHGVVWGYDGMSFKTIHDNGDKAIVHIASNGFFCSEDKLFILPEDE